MQNLTEAAVTNGQSARTTTQNPVRAFESAAKKIWDSPRNVEDKSAQLTGLGKTITHYIGKIDDMLAREHLDVWVRLSVNRSKVYLEQLANDVNILALRAGDSLEK